MQCGGVFVKPPGQRVLRAAEPCGARVAVLLPANEVPATTDHVVHPEDGQQEQGDVHGQVEAPHGDHDLCLEHQGPSSHDLPAATHEAHHPHATYPAHALKATECEQGQPVAADQCEVGEKPGLEVVLHGGAQPELQFCLLVPEACDEAQRQVYGPKNTCDPHANGKRVDRSLLLALVPCEAVWHDKCVVEEHEHARCLEQGPGQGVGVPCVPDPAWILHHAIAAVHRVPCPPPNKGSGGAVGVRAMR
mmetsp:Transcript_97037/g.301829  ORF Transcript_97037/g.301829 Transcript_97037/m.301829 type:complete len:248 (-) Transcript_97037:491-1234(-)